MKKREIKADLKHYVRMIRADLATADVEIDKENWKALGDTVESIEEWITKTAAAVRAAKRARRQRS